MFDARRLSVLAMLVLFTTGCMPHQMRRGSLDVPPIPLQFIGTIEGRTVGKIAILLDGSGTTLYGREGSLILGRYRIIRIEVNAVVLEYIDDWRRQSIPLKGHQ
jgi:hypothetical protein